MGIYDREYYRREGPSFLGAFTDRGKVCKWIILVNVAIFVGQLLTRPELPQFKVNANGEPIVSEGIVTDFLILNTHAVMHGEVWRLLSYAFLHDPDNLFHLFFNMAFLWWFGKDVEDLHGQKEFLIFYLVAAFLGGLAFQLASLTHLGGDLCLGASGAVTAVLVLCACHYPTRTINLFFFLPIPIWLFVLFNVAQDSFIFLSGSRSHTAVTVHLAGAAFGFLYYKRHWRLVDLLPNLRSWQRQRSRPRLKVYRDEPGPEQPVAVPASPSAADVDEQLEAKVDAVLEKVAREGQNSLTESERQILLRASEVYKKKRT